MIIQFHNYKYEVSTYLFWLILQVCQIQQQTLLNVFNIYNADMNIYQMTWQLSWQSMPRFRFLFPWVQIHANSVIFVCLFQMFVKLQFLFNQFFLPCLAYPGQYFFLTFQILFQNTIGKGVEKWQRVIDNSFLWKKVMIYIILYSFHIYLS